MDPNLGNQPYSNTPEQPNLSVPNDTKKGLFKTLSILEVGIIEALFVGIVLIILFGILNYFNILSISKLWPKYFGFLPNNLPAVSNQNSQIPEIIRKNVQAFPIKISCPSTKDFCQNAQDIIKNQQYIGIGYKLASGSGIFAAFGGNLIVKSGIDENPNSNPKTSITAYLDNADLAIRAKYFFRGKVLKTGKVSRGDTIAVSNGKLIKNYDNHSLVFSLIQGFPTNNSPLPLAKNSFE